jgi:membrane fusion protein YbhG
MKNRRIPVIVVIIIIVVIGGYYGLRAMADGTKGALKASGTIEARTVNLSPELPGKVSAVLVDEGDRVQAGQVLFRLDDTLLAAQHEAALSALAVAQSAAQTAQAGVAAAQAQYDLADLAARSQARSTRLADWTGRTPDYFNQPKWYFTQSEQLTAAQAEVLAAQAGVTSAEQGLAQVVADLKDAQFVAAEQRLASARASYLVALQVQAEGQAVGAGLAPDELPVHFPAFLPGYKLRVGISKTLPNNAQLSDAAQTAYDRASAELTAAQQAYDELLASAQAQAVLKARAAVAVAHEREQAAAERLSSLQTGEQSPQVAAAAAQLAQAQHAAQQASEAVGQAQANVKLLEAQLGKLEVRAPLEGVVLTRNIEPGEYVAPGGSALTVGQLEALTITVYVPEDRYGQIHLGQGAEVVVDSFGGQAFRAQVSAIADQAEFTPRNVQTVEGRSSTVYAVKLRVSDPAGKLKPGMPADVTFDR